jgi:hypothetical protein
VTSDDFVVSGSTRKDVLLKDRDLSSAPAVLKLNVGGKHPEDGLQVDATLGVDVVGCLAGLCGHIQESR